MKVDDIKDKELRDAVQHLRYISSMTSNTPTMALVNKSAIKIVVDNLLRLISASTPSAEVEAKIDKLRDSYSWIKKEKEVLEAEVMALQKIPLSASTSGDFITPDYIKGWNAAIEALNHTGGR